MSQKLLGKRNFTGTKVSQGAISLRAGNAYIVYMALALTLGGCGISQSLAPPKQTTPLNRLSESPALPKKTTTGRNFAYWCQNQANLSVDARLTVELLLGKAGTNDCNQAESVLSSVTNLTLYNKKISDLSPLTSLTNLTNLSLISNKISDLSPLKSLTNLEMLDLFDNQIKDISPLESLTNLRILNLYGNQIKDISPLKSLTKLTLLNLGGNQIKDASSLKSLTDLKTLDLSSNQIKDVSPLKSLTKLTTLKLQADLLTNETCPVNPYTICQF